MHLRTLVKIVIGCLIPLVFSGCSSKLPIYQKERCSVENPSRTIIVEVCGSLESYNDKMYCLINKYNTLDSDYKLKESYVEECIK